MRHPASPLSARALAGSAVLGLTVLLGLFGQPALRAEEKAGKAAALVVRVQSVNELIVNGQALAKLGGKPQEGTQLTGIAKALVGPSGKSGVDGSKPIGLYVILDPDMVEHSAVVLVPVANQKAFLETLENFKLKAATDKPDDGVYALNIEVQNFQLPAYLKFHKGYACVALRESAALSKNKLLDPAEVLTGDASSLVSVAVKIDAIPELMRNTAVSFLQDKILQEKDKREPKETDAIHKVKGQLLDQMFAGTQAVLSDGSDLKLNVQFDRTAGDLGIDVSLAGKSGSGLAKTFAGLGEGKSLFAGFTTGAALSLVGHAALPESVRAALEPVIEEGLQEAIAKEKDETKRKAGEIFLKALSPTLKSGAFDGGVVFRGPNAEGKYTLLVGSKLVKGLAVEQVVRELVKSAPAEDQDKVKLDASSVGTYKIHEITTKDLPPDARRVFGDGPVYLTFRPDALILAFGTDAEAAIKEAVAAHAGVAPTFNLDVSVAKLIPLAKEYQAEAKKAAAELSAEKGNDRVRVVVRGGESLSAKVSMKAALITYFTELDRLKKAGGNAGDDK
jgi:hypothetical protein